MAEDPKLTHAREFTNIEDTTLDVWLQAENANADDNARKVLDAGLMFEHYTSLLDNDPAKRSQQELVQQMILKGTMDDEIRLAKDAIAEITKSGSKTGATLQQQISLLNQRLLAVEAALGIQNLSDGN